MSYLHIDLTNVCLTHFVKKYVPDLTGRKSLEYPLLTLVPRNLCCTKYWKIYDRHWYSVLIYMKTVKSLTPNLLLTTFNAAGSIIKFHFENEVVASLLKVFT